MTTEITLTESVTDIRGGGYGANAWIAKITSTDPKFGFKREFCRKNKSGMSGSGRSGIISFEMQGAGIYEFRNFCVGSTARNHEWSGFVLINDDGTVHEISKSRAQEIISQAVTA